MVLVWSRHPGGGVRRRVLPRATGSHGGSTARSWTDADGLRSLLLRVRSPWDAGNYQCAAETAGVRGPAGVALSGSGSCQFHLHVLDRSRRVGAYWRRSLLPTASVAG